MYSEYIPDIFRKYIDLINISKITIEDDIINIEGVYKTNLKNSKLRGKKGNIYIGNFIVDRNRKVKRIVYSVNGSVYSIVQFNTSSEIADFDVHFVEFKVVLSSLRHVDGLLNFLIE